MAYYGVDTYASARKPKENLTWFVLGLESFDTVNSSSILLLVHFYKVTRQPRLRHPVIADRTCTADTIPSYRSVQTTTNALTYSSTSYILVSATTKDKGRLC